MQRKTNPFNPTGPVAGFFLLSADEITAAVEELRTSEWGQHVKNTVLHKHPCAVPMSSEIGTGSAGSRLFVDNSTGEVLLVRTLSVFIKGLDWGEFVFSNLTIPHRIYPAI